MSEIVEEVPKEQVQEVEGDSQSKEVWLCSIALCVVEWKVKKGRADYAS